MARSGGNYIGVKTVDEPQRFGIVEVERGCITSLVEKPDEPKSDLAVVGVYMIEDSSALYSALDSVITTGTKTKGEFQLTDALNLMIDDGITIKAFEVEGWFDCGKPETLLDTNKALLEIARPKVEVPGSIVVPPVYVADDAKIETSVIGPHVSVAVGSVVRRSIVRNSIIGENALVEDALLDSSLIGDNAIVRGMFKKLNVGDSSEIDFT
jgi:glucose-1-phosphate thymidylyltransferase